MTRLLPTALLALCLSACATLSAPPASPASDLATLRATAERSLAPRLLPNGRTYCLEDAATEGAQDTCAGALEAAFAASEADKATALAAIRRGLLRLELARLPACRFYQVGCFLARQRLQAQLDGLPPAP